LDSAGSPTQTQKIPGTLQNGTEMHTGTFPRHMHSTTLQWRLTKVNQG